MSHLTISQEFLSMGKDKDIDKFTHKLSEFSRDIRKAIGFKEQVVSMGWTYNPNTLRYIKNRFKYEEDLKSYSNMRQTRVVAPPGFKGQMLKYSEELLAASVTITNLEDKYIKPIEAQLSICYADPERFKKTNTGNVGDLMAGDLADITTNLASYFDGTQNTDDAILGDLYLRNKDIEDTVDNLYNVLGNLSKLTPERMNSRAALMSSLVDKLIVRLKQDPEGYAVNGINAKVVGELTYTLAKAFEFYALIQVQSNIAVRAVIDSFDK